jgi:D-alanyl-D-alanine carboxypeptidase
MTQKGYSYTAAYNSVIQYFAFPGSSEHQLAQALDIMGRVDRYYENPNHPVFLWLQEHCWEYGFILRYPDSKSHITGIIHEPWHYRYVGVELAMELKDSGLCLEEYLDLLTNDGTTCGNPDALNQN